MNALFTAELFRTIRTFIRSAGGVLITYLIIWGLNTLADKDLIRVSAVLSTFINISGNVYISWALTGGAVIYGYRERLLRRKTIKQLGGKVKQYEGEFWPERTSSELNEDGTTSEEDR